MNNTVPTSAQLAVITALLPQEEISRRAPTLAAALATQDPKLICKNRSRVVNRVYRELDLETAPAAGMA